MNILLAINTFDVGGAENFTLNLAKAFSVKGHSVFLFQLYNFNEHNDRIKDILAEEYDKIIVYTHYKPSLILDFILWRVNGILSRFGIKAERSKILHYLNIRKLKSFIVMNNIDLVNSHLFETDEFFSKYFNLPHIISMHGPYEYYLWNNNVNPDKRIDKIDNKFLSKAIEVLEKSGYVIFVADKNSEIFNHFDHSKIHSRKIHYGFSLPHDAYNIRREPLKPINEFVFGMIARGIESKGWEIAIKAFLELRNLAISKKIKLQLVFTETDYMSRLKSKYGHYKDVEFIGFVQGREKSIIMNGFNSMILPTYNDCLPVVIIESLLLEIPVIATGIGEIPNILCRKGLDAGLVISVDSDSGVPDYKKFADAMFLYIQDDSIYKRHKNNTKTVKEIFNIDICADAYIDFYKLKIENFKKTGMRK